MRIETNSCPNCGAGVTVDSTADQVQCEYCGSTLFVDRSAEYSKLVSGEQLSDTLVDIGNETRDTIRASAEATQLELQRIQLRQELTSAQLQLTTIEGEIRSLKRAQPTRTVRRQLSELREREDAIRARIADLEAALYPGMQEGETETTFSKVKSRGSKGKPWYRSFWVLLVLFFVLNPLWAILIVTDKTQGRFVKFLAWLILFYFVITTLARLGSSLGG